MNARFLLFPLLVAGLFACKPEPKVGPSGQEPKVDLSGLDWRYTDNTVRVGMYSEPASLNPLFSTAATTRYVSELIFQSINSQDSDTFEEVPLLASLPNVEKQADGSVAYSYVINEAARWPNGTPVTATDVAFSIKLYLLPNVATGAYRIYYSPIKNVVTSPNDERRFKIITREGHVNTQQALASILVFPEYIYDPEKTLRTLRLADLTNDRKIEDIVAQPAIKQFAANVTDAERNRTPAALVGSGPYALETWEDGQRISLVKREDYWADDQRAPLLQAKPDGVIFEVIPDPTTMATAVRDGLVDAVIDLKPDEFSELRTDPEVSARYNFTTVPSFKYFAVLLNVQNPLLEDRQTRRALAHLVDVDELIETLFEGDLATRVTGPILPSKSYYNEDLAPIAYAPEKAADLLTAAGWADTNGDGTLDKEINGNQEALALQMLIFPSPTSEAIGTLMKQWAAEVGVEIELVAKEPRMVYADYNQGDYDMGLIGAGSDPNPDDLTQNWASSSIPPEGTNRSGFADAEADRLIRQLRTTLSASKRDPMYRRVQEIIYEQQPMIFLFSPLDRVVYAKRFTGTPNSISPNMDWGTLEQADWNAVDKE